MIRIEIDKEISEIGIFFEGLSLRLPAKSSFYGREQYRTWVRRLVALQIATHVYPHRLKTSERYLKECFSDFVSAFSLAHLGYYKSADYLMRSAIENLCRAVLINKGLSRDVKNLKDTRDLFRLFKREISNHVESDFTEIRSAYARLSEAVHTSKNAHMALLAALEGAPRFSQKQLLLRADAASKLLRAFLAIIFAEYMEPNSLRRVRPVHLHDFFLDNVRHSLKRKVQAAL